MPFAEKLKNEPGFGDAVRRAVEIDKMSPEELLDLPEETIQNFSSDELEAAMEKIMHGFHYVTLDEHHRSGFDPRWNKYLEAASARLEFDNNQ